MGSRKIANDGYVVDFGNIKKVTRKICKELNEHFLCPMLSDVMEITTTQKDGGDSAKDSVTLTCQDGSTFVFPKIDCALLPIVHATTEELGIYLWSRILEGLNAQYLIDRGVHTMEVTVNEAVGQEAIFRHEIPTTLGESKGLDVRAFIMEGEVVPMPCPSAPGVPTSSSSSAKGKSDGACADGQCASCRQAFHSKLQKLADAINSKQTSTGSSSEITVKDLEQALEG